MAKPWLDEEIAYLRTNAGFLPMHRIAEKLGHPLGSCWGKAHELGVRATSPHGTKSTRETADHFGVSTQDVRRWADRGCPHLAAEAGRERVRRFFDIDLVSDWLDSLTKTEAA